MKLEDPSIKDNLLRRLHRLEGQMRGVESMISEERDCAEVLQQLSAARSALEGVKEVYLQQMIAECMNREELSKKEIADQIAHLVIQHRN